MSEYKEYTFEYWHDGLMWALDIFAKDEQDAKEKILSIQNAKFWGEVQLTLVVPSEN